MDDNLNAVKKGLGKKPACIQEKNKHGWSALLVVLRTKLSPQTRNIGDIVLAAVIASNKKVVRARDTAPQITRKTTKS